MEGNSLWAKHWDGILGQGPSLPALWTQEERMSNWLGRREGAPWKGNENGEYLQAGTIKFSVEKRDEHRAEKREERIRQQEAKGLGKLPRDLPPKTATDSPLKYLEGSLAHRRMLILWWIGAFPGHRGDTCGICNEVIPVEGGRAHVARCVNSLPESTLPETIALFEERVAPRAVALRRSRDPITLAIWEMCLRKQYSLVGDYAGRVYWALEAVSTHCLGRENARVDGELVRARDNEPLQIFGDPP